MRRTWMSTVAVVFWLCVVWAVCAPAADGKNNHPLNDRVFQVGDVIRIVFDHPEWAKKPPLKQRIKEDGSITLPYINTVIATNKTPFELQEEIRQSFLGRKIYKNLNVIVLPANARIFSVHGAVNKPGWYPYEDDLTVTKAIAMAGGFAEMAKKNLVFLSHEDGTVEEVDCVAVGKNPKLDRPVLPGDFVKVTHPDF